MSRLPQSPAPVEVETDAGGVPVRLRWERDEPVLEVSARWRVDYGWWRLPVSRMYWELRTPSALLEVYEDLLEGGWRLERMRD